MKASAVLFAAEGDQYLGTPYSEMDCQAFVETMLRGVGINLNLRGSNAWFREMDWTGTPEECKRVFGCIPLGAMLYIWQPDGAPSRYKDALGNATHIGVYIGRMDGAIHSSQSRGKVCYSKFAGKTIRGGWNRVGLWHALDYGQSINAIINGTKTTQRSDPMEPMIVTAENGGTVNVRRDPSTTSQKAAVLKVGTQVQAEPEKDGWRKITYNGGKTGYMMAEFLEPAQITASPAVATTTDLQAPAGQFVTLTLTQDDLQKLLQARDLMISVLGVG